MMEDIHIADGTALKLLLAGIVLAGGMVGALAQGPLASQAAADEPAVELAFPINNVTVDPGTQQLSLDGKGNDPYPAAFPIDNVTLRFPIDNVTDLGNSWDSWITDRIGSRGIGLPEDSTWALALTEVPDELPQDMDPY